MQIDNSQLQCYIDCPRRYFNRYVRGLRKQQLDASDVDREFGKCFHKSCEILYKEGDLEKAKNVFRTEFNLIETEKAKTPANGERLVEAYHNYWSQPVNELSDTNMETIAVEQKGMIRLSDDVEWIVKIDRITKNGAGIWDFETKTTSKLAYNYFKKFDLNMQISGYCQYVKEKYGQCSGAIINVAVVGYRERAYKGEPAGFHCQFVRDIVNRSEDQLGDWRKQVLGWAQRLALDLHTSHDGQDNTPFTQNTNACYQFKGCGFLDLCKSCGDKSVEEVMYEKYDPFEYLNEEVT